MVFLVVETSHLAKVEPVRTANTGEVVDHSHGAFAFSSHTERKHFAWETAAAFIHGDDFITVNQVVGNLHVESRFFHHCDFLESTIKTHTLAHHITLCVGVGALCIGCWLPSEGERIRTSRINGETVDRKWLHHIVAMVALCDKFQDTFINGTAHIKSEIWIQTVFHISEILVRKKFHQKCRNLWHTSLVIRSVPHATTSPVWLIFRTNHVAHFRRYKICEITRENTWSAVFVVAKCALSIACRVNQQGADNIVVHGGAGIGVQAERNVNWHVQALLLWEHLRATCQVIHPQTTAAIVVVVIVGAF